MNQPCLSGGCDLDREAESRCRRSSSFFAPSPSVPVIETSFLSQPLTVTSPLMFETSMRASALTLRVSLIGVPAAAAPDYSQQQQRAEWRAVGFIGIGLRQPAFAPNCSIFMRCALVRFRRLTRNTASGCCSSACCNSECAASSTMFAPARRGSWPERSACSRASLRRDALEARRHRVVVGFDRRVDAIAQREER